MKCPKKCGGELQVITRNNRKYAKCNRCSSLFTVEDLQNYLKQPEPIRPPEKKPKKNFLKTGLSAIGIALGALLIIFIISNVINDSSKHSEGTAKETSVEPETTDLFVEETQPMDILIQLIEAGVATKKFDGYTLDYDEQSITVNAWRKSITETVNRLQSEGAKADNESWVWLKNNTKNTPDYMYDCIKNSTGHEDMVLTFNVLDDENHDRILLTIINTDIVYDILAQ